MDIFQDVLRGAGEISKIVYGKNTKENRRRIYHKHERKQLPTWKEGAEIITTRTALREHYQLKRDTPE
jgi:hypothetical protein